MEKSFGVGCHSKWKLFKNAGKFFLMYTLQWGSMMCKQGEKRIVYRTSILPRFELPRLSISFLRNKDNQESLFSRFSCIWYPPGELQLWKLRAKTVQTYQSCSLYCFEIALGY